MEIERRRGPPAPDRQASPRSADTARPRGRTPSDHHPNTLTARVNLAVSYGQAGRTDKAITILERVVADRERLLGGTAPPAASGPRPCDEPVFATRPELKTGGRFRGAAHTWEPCT
ncbi:tetratricopeptide repeat protein [Streptomyces lavendulocolor]|uniref:tetratricopeptide repeat protein n=1 Tax=Streptomyces lavendulocolor TaxID=67316 RepID=UPI003C2F0400